MSSTFDSVALSALGDEVDALIAAGKWTRAEFERIWELTEAVAGGEDDCFEGLLRKADPSWI